MPFLKSIIQRFPALVFTILALGIVYGILLPLYYWGNAEAFYGPLKVFFAFTPTLSAIILTIFLLPEGGIESFFQKLFVKETSISWYLLALFIFPFLGFSGMGLRFLYDGHVHNWSEFSGWLEILGMSLPLLLFPGIAEEFGWRGFLQPTLQKKLNVFIASGIVGLVWATWHYRDFLMGEWSREQNGVLWFYMITVGVSMIIGWLTDKTKGNIMIAMLAHFGANVVFSFFPIFKTMSYTSAYFYIGSIAGTVFLLIILHLFETRSK